ncbi:helix-turn-helix transcriptional regulator [Roseomonas sp. GC11]|uniref:winged helix-turn-helix transcriptional regulator n=1 Tax=Roseomonas sp. GC11 TaxID=2950546 RepID=UPI002108F170|nr:helix-turn-helix domain-containing protein [Roseomonas sp. GC11]MCQ4161866.1 helix-turn-helix transcriptional regulator [Roseomonas sp. GC11]
MQNGDLFDPACPTRLVLDRIADKWTVMLLVLLHREGRLRFNGLRRATGISQKVLSQALRRLERDGFVSRQVFASVPVTVEYAITPLGADLAQALATLRDWAEAHIGAVLAAQRRYDAEAQALAAE